MAENSQNRGGKTGKMHILVKRIANLWIAPTAMLLLVAQQEVAKKRAGASSRERVMRANKWRAAPQKISLTPLQSKKLVL
jgi:hypothetical protein